MPIYAGIGQDVQEELEVMKKRRGITAAAAVLMAAVLMGGCADKTLDASQVAATVGEEEISLGLANFAARLQQAEIETYYMSYFGTNMWSQEMGEEGQTYEESVKESALENLRNAIVIRSHAQEYGVALTEEDEAAISEAVTQFLSDNEGNEKGLERMTATEETVTEMLNLMTIQEKMYYAIVAEANVEVTDEEAAQKAADYVYVSNTSHTNEDGESVDYTEEEKEELRAQMQDIIDTAQETGDFAAAAEEYDLTVSSATFGGDAVTARPDDVAEAADALAEGEYSDVIDTGTAYYVVHLTSEFDEEATQTRREELISEGELAFYEETVAAWAEEVTFTVNEDVWDQVTFASPMTIETTEEETGETEETGGTTEEETGETEETGGTTEEETGETEEAGGTTEEETGETEETGENVQTEEAQE